MTTVSPYTIYFLYNKKRTGVYRSKQKQTKLQYKSLISLLFGKDQ